MLDDYLKKYNLNLTEQQREAVESVDGPTLLLAVPGSGKTTTLVARLGYMIYEKNIAPENILVLTYTVAATKDMSERFCKIFGDEMRERLEFRTINGVCSKIISYYARQIGKSPFPLETDEKRKNARIANIYARIENEYPTESEIRDTATAITYIKNMMLNDEEIKKYSQNTNIDLESIYKEYIKIMQQEGIMDYDDQMRYAYNILKASSSTLCYFQNMFKYVCVDEAQDTSKIQHAIIKLLASGADNLFMVGDEDQSIYAWRAAYPDALLQYEKEHKNARVLMMEENFRSNAKIVNTADRFIQKNFYRHKKKMHPHREEGSDIKLKELSSRAAQYDYLAKKLSNVKKETAVLYKNNESVLPLIDRLDRMDIPFRIKNAEMMFFTNRIVVDILDILRFSQNPYDTDIFLKIYYKMNLYISKNEAIKICEKSKEKNTNILIVGKSFPFESRFKNERFIDLANDIKELSGLKPATAISRIVSVTGYSEYLEKNHIKENKSFILREIAKQCDNYRSFIERLEELKRKIATNEYSPNTNIILSTIHSSKGLEYKTVYMLDVIDGILPEKKPDIGAMKEERMYYEEERKLYYVGITRAKDNLILLDTKLKSTFINETVRNYESDINPRSIFGKQKEKNTNTRPEISYIDYCQKLKAGTKINHKVLGEGTITNVQIPYVTIKFSEQSKTMSAKVLQEKNLITFQ